jgi:hypothetical protein
MYPPRKAGGAGFVTLALLEPGRALGFAARQIGQELDDAPEGSWTFVVTPLDGGSTRLIVRGRGTGQMRFWPAVFNLAAFEPMHFAMERRTLTSIKELAEGGRPSTRADTVQVVSWTAVFAGALAAAVATLSVRRFGRPLAAFAGLGLLFQLLTFVQPSPAVGGAILVALATAPWWLGRVRARRRTASQGLGAQIG